MKPKKDRDKANAMREAKGASVEYRHYLSLKIIPIFDHRGLSVIIRKDD